jgi:hypothetical protein
MDVTKRKPGQDGTAFEVAVRFEAKGLDVMCFEQRRNELRVGQLLSHDHRKTTDTRAWRIR